MFEKTASAIFNFYEKIGRPQKTVFSKPIKTTNYYSNKKEFFTFLSRARPKTKEEVDIFKCATGYDFRQLKKKNALKLMSICKKELRKYTYMMVSQISDLVFVRAIRMLQAKKLVELAPFELEFSQLEELAEIMLLMLRRHYQRTQDYHNSQKMNDLWLD